MSYYYSLSEKRLYSESDLRAQYETYYPMMQDNYTDTGNKGFYAFTAFLPACLSCHGEFITLEKYLSEWLSEHYF